MKKVNLVITVLLLIIFGLVIYNIFSKPETVVNDYDAEIQNLEAEILIYKNAIVKLTLQADSLSGTVHDLEIKSDSLEQVKTKVKTIYHEIYIDINNSSNTQLDSIIRSNW